jgi:hypothetical protein
MMHMYYDLRSERYGVLKSSVLLKMLPIKKDIQCLKVQTKNNSPKYVELWGLFLKEIKNRGGDLL